MEFHLRNCRSRRPEKDRRPDDLFPLFFARAEILADRSTFASFLAEFGIDVDNKVARIM